MAGRRLTNQNLFEEKMALQCEVKALTRQIEEFKSGKRYLKLQEDYRCVERGYIREIESLKRQNAALHSQVITNRNMWMEENTALWENSRKEIGQKEKEILRLKDQLLKCRIECDEKIADLTTDYEERLYEKDCIIQELKNKLAHAEALLGRDSTNTGLPTSQTPPGKEKHIPNSRRGSGKKKGGQPGHQKHTLARPADEEITGEEEHPLGEDAVCPSCGCGDLVFTGDYDERCEIDIEIKVKKIRHKYWLYECSNCGKTVKSAVDPTLWADCQYGPMVQAVSLSLMTTSNTAINKVPVHLLGLTNGEVKPSEGYIAKLMPRAAKGLAAFMEGLFKVLVARALVYWDDTVVMADGKRICLRFYGDDTIAYYVAHDKKDMAGVIEDGVLDALTEEAMVMHDHNSINYNERFKFRNIECNAHGQRDLQRIIDMTGHEEAGELKDLISSTIKERNDLVAKGTRHFSEEYIQTFHETVTNILTRAEVAAEANTSIYSGSFERAVIRRFQRYRDNYFAWVEDFSIPTTNNLSERALRGVKTKMKVSGQFASSKTANNYAVVRSYIETCRRNGINEMQALSRLCAGNPYTVEEIFLSG